MAYKVSDQELGLFFFFLGLFPDESYDEWVADMICDGVKDLITLLVKIFHEKDETKKVYLVEPMFLCIWGFGCLLSGMILAGSEGPWSKAPIKKIKVR